MFNSYVRSILSGNSFNAFAPMYDAEKGGGVGEGGSEGETGTEGGEGGTQGGTESQKEEGKESGKAFTQDDVNNLIAKETRKATEKLLKSLGVTDFKTAKEGLDKFKEIQESQKTDAQKAIEKAQNLEKDYTEMQKTNNTLNAQLAALKAGVKADSLEDVIVLANNLVSDDKTIDDAIKDVLKKYPNFAAGAAETKETTKETKKPSFTQGEHKNDNKQTEQDKWLAAFKFGQ